MMRWGQLFKRKDLQHLIQELANENRLRRALGPVSLTALGVGCIIGAGIFVMTGRAAAEDAGPAITISYGVAALGYSVSTNGFAQLWPTGMSSSCPTMTSQAASMPRIGSQASSPAWTGLVGHGLALMVASYFPLAASTVLTAASTSPSVLMPVDKMRGRPLRAK